jgi:hypothetical protein
LLGEAKELLKEIDSSGSKCAPGPESVGRGRFIGLPDFLGKSSTGHEIAFIPVNRYDPALGAIV